MARRTRRASARPTRAGEHRLSAVASVVASAWPVSVMNVATVARGGEAARANPRTVVRCATGPQVRWNTAAAAGPAPSTFVPVTNRLHLNVCGAGGV